MGQSLSINEREVVTALSVHVGKLPLALHVLPELCETHPTAAVVLWFVAQVHLQLSQMLLAIICSRLTCNLLRSRFCDVITDPRARVGLLIVGWVEALTVAGRICCSLV